MVHGQRIFIWAYEHVCGAACLCCCNIAFKVIDDQPVRQHTYGCQINQLIKACYADCNHRLQNIPDYAFVHTGPQSIFTNLYALCNSGQMWVHYQDYLQNGRFFAMVITGACKH